MDRPVVSVLAFLFSPKGRMARLPHLAFVIVSYGVFISLTWVLIGHAGIQRTILIVAIIALFAIKFIMLSRRFHDIRLPALVGAPTLMLLSSIIYNNTAVKYLHMPSNYIPGNVSLFGHMVDLTTATVATLFLLMILTDVALIFIPGTKGANRYGDDGRTPTGAVADIF